MLSLLAVVQIFIICNTADAQKDSVTRAAAAGRRSRAWIAPVGIATSYVFDPEVREWALNEHSRGADRLARLVNPLGTARVLVPSMVVTYAGAILTHHDSFADATLATAAGYVASDIAESVLKPVIGRERPHVAGNSHRFHPFTTNGDWHSLPSAHVAHIAAIAEAVSLESRSTAVTTLCGALVAAVGWDRVYEDQHWTSDVAATAALSSLISGATVRWVASRLGPR